MDKGKREKGEAEIPRWIFRNLIYDLSTTRAFTLPRSNYNFQTPS